MCQQGEFQSRGGFVAWWETGNIEALERERSEGGRVENSKVRTGG